VSDFKPGDRVYVTDPILARLRQRMQEFGHDSKPNHHGTVDEVVGDYIVIAFDNDDGPGQGAAAPYLPEQVHRLVSEVSDV
jgi:hypothetical protein